MKKKLLVILKTTGGNMNAGKPIWDVAGMATAMRYTEYKDIYSALSEIVDNSIEAQSTDIIILIYETLDNFGRKIIGDIAILDNGTGMDLETLHSCLVFGNSTRKEHTSMGRFGVGLGQASMYAAPRVEVFSWQDNTNPYMVYLDTDEMRKSIQLTIEYPIQTDIPSWFSGFLKCSLPKIGRFDFKTSGTLVLWKNVDRISIKPATFYTNLSLELGRRFRYFINNGQRIVVTTTQHAPCELIKPIDPMFLLEKSRYLASIKHSSLLADEEEQGEPIFEPFISDLTPEGICNINFKLISRQGLPTFSQVQLKCSIVKEKYYYDSTRSSGYFNPGRTPIGDKVKLFEKISVVRARREIQFDRLNLYESISDPTNRWWRIELCFNPDLDDFFTLSNNKQKIEIKVDFREKKKFGLKNQITDTRAETEEDSELEEIAWKLIIGSFDTLMSAMKKRNSKLSQNMRKETKEVVNVTPSLRNDEPITVSKNSFYTKIIIPDKQITQIKTEPYLTDNTDSGDHNVFENPLMKNKIEQLLEDYIEVEYINEKCNDFVAFSRILGEDICQINRNHELLNTIEESLKFQQGVEFMLTNLAHIKKNFRIYEEQMFFEKAIKLLNQRMNEIKVSMEDVK